MGTLHIVILVSFDEYNAPEMFQYRIVSGRISLLQRGIRRQFFVPSPPLMGMLTPIRWAMERVRMVAMPDLVRRPVHFAPGTATVVTETLLHMEEVEGVPDEMLLP